jgi:FkbM family methyltransferase
MKSKIWNLSKKIIPNYVHKFIKKIYTHIFCYIYPNGYFKKFNFLNITFLIKVNPKNGVVDNIILNDGVLDGEHLTIIKNKLSPSDCFIDVGANIGQYSLFASKCIPSGRVISFEPVKEIFNQFKESVFKNKIQNITLYNKACGDSKQHVTIYKKNGDAGGSSIINLDFGKKETVELIEVVTLDDILINIEKISFIKIDVEGYEYEVLCGAQKIIHKFKPVLLIEYSPHIYCKNKEENGKLILDFLLKNKYIIKDLENDRIINSSDDGKVLKKQMTYLLCE